MNDPVAIISDIHGNLQALQAVIADIEQMGILRCQQSFSDHERTMQQQEVLDFP
jgi:hypothetical protein